MMPQQPARRWPGARAGQVQFRLELAHTASRWVEGFQLRRSQSSRAVPVLLFGPMGPARTEPAPCGLRPGL